MKILQYCDDTTLLLNSLDELPEAFDNISQFYKISGLKLNINKSIGFGIGSSKDILGNPGNLHWKSKDEITKILGIHFNSMQEASDIEENWIPKLEKIKELAIKLQRRPVSLWGKVLLCKTFLLSQLSFTIQALSMPTKYIQELETICFKFIWHKQNEKKTIERIKRQVMCLDKDDGGAGMIKGGSQQKLFLIKWILKVGEGNFKSIFCTSKIPDIYFSHVGGIDYFFSITCPYSKLPTSDLLTRFWKDAIQSWLVFKHNIKIFHNSKPTNLKDIFGTLPQDRIPLFLNPEIVFGPEPLFHHGWMKCDFKYLHQIMDENGGVKDFNLLPDSITTLPDSIFMLNALKLGFSKVKRQRESPIDFLRENQLMPGKILKIPNNILRSIIELDPALEPLGMKFWKRKLELDIFPKYISSLRSLNETKLQVTLFKLFHNIQPSKIMLKKWNLEESDRCDCGEIDFIDHSLVTCNYLDPLWNEVKQIIIVSTGERIQLTLSSKLFGLSMEDGKNLNINNNSLSIINNILLIAKFSINKARSEKSDILLCFESEWNFRKDQIMNKYS